MHAPSVGDGPACQCRVGGLVWEEKGRGGEAFATEGSQRCGVVHSPHIGGNRISIINNILQALQCPQWTTSQDLIKGLLLSQHAAGRASCIYPSRMLPSHNLLLCNEVHYRYLRAPCRASRIYPSSLLLLASHTLLLCNEVHYRYLHAPWRALCIYPSSLLVHTSHNLLLCNEVY
jgi:hypothetical protein